jgi:phosphotriesterase-related protein
MQLINTVNGTAQPADLGYTLIHEHVSVSSPGLWQAWPALFGGRQQVLDAAVAALSEARAAGIETFVDATTIDLGRDIRLLRDAADASGMRVVACTGHWLDPSSTMRNRSTEELESFFRTEIEDGIEGTDIRAGVIKVATHGGPRYNEANDKALVDFLDRSLRAASKAQRATGIPIITHSGAKFRTGETQADLFDDEGVDPRKVVIGHSDDTDDVDYLTGILDRGYWLGMDRLALGAFPDYSPPDVEGRIAVVAGLIKRGYERQLLLSHDHAIHMGASTSTRREALAAATPDGIMFINRVFIPALIERGVSEATTHQLMIDNPRRLFEGEAVGEGAEA